MSILKSKKCDNTIEINDNETLDNGYTEDMDNHDEDTHSEEFYTPDQNTAPSAITETIRKKAQCIAKFKKKILIIATPIICAVIAFFIVLNTVVIPNNKYNNAIKLMNSGNIVEAYEIFIELDDYKDSTEKAYSLYDTYKVEKLKVAKAGDYIFFGSYEQDNNTANGKEDIEWLVLEVKDGKALLISKYALDCKPYNTEHTDVTWATCSLRKWLNDEFLNTAFSSEEKAKVPTTTVSGNTNPEYGTDPGAATQDRVFLLSITQANDYFKSDRERVCNPTDLAVARGAWENPDGNCWWWLRSPGKTQDAAAAVFGDGDIYESGDDTGNDNNAVRPALWMELNP